jgi:hypothetical protein
MDQTFVCEPVETAIADGRQWSVFRLASGGARELLDSFRRYPDAMRLMRQLRHTDGAAPMAAEH